MLFTEKILEGDKVRLVPLSKTHQPELLAAAQDGKLWELWFTSVPRADTIEAYLAKTLAEKEQGLSFPYAVVEKTTGTVIGTTRYCNIDAANRRLEVGYTWYAKSSQRTGVNTECKYLLLRHAFEHLVCIAVEFRTNWFNVNSRNAILRLGAKQDGVLRNHRIDGKGVMRDTVVFSIIASEWPAVRKSLAFKLSR
jgi:RimJ/RimL family protein N-acetyltransferase